MKLIGAAAALSAASACFGVRSSTTFQVAPGSGSFSIAATPGQGSSERCYSLTYDVAGSSSGTGSCADLSATVLHATALPEGGRMAVGGVAANRVVRVRVRAGGHTYTTEVSSDRSFMIVVPYARRFRVVALDRKGRVLDRIEETAPVSPPYAPPNAPPNAPPYLPPPGGGQAPP